MKNKDTGAVNRQELAQDFLAAMATGDEQKIAQAMADMAGNIQEQVLQEAASINFEQMDMNVLAQRGIRQLTSAEKKYYEALIGAMSNNDPKQALKSLDVTMPETIIEDVFAELTAEHPLLNAINFQNTTYVTKWILNKHGKQIAAWGKVTDEVKKEIESSFEELNMTLYSLTAFMPVSKAMLELGPQWIDKYVREVLKDALYVGLEEGIVNGTGIDMPIGMMKDLEASKTAEEPYPDKKAIKVTKFTPEKYGELIAQMAVNRNGRPRAVTKVVMVVNPVDYFRKIMPATTVMTPQGTYVNNVLPFPTDVIQCEQMPEGKAVIGLADKYFMGMGTGKDGVIEASDEVHFLQRERVYLAYIYGNGKPMDNRSFLVLDISELNPSSYTVVAALEGENEEAPAVIEKQSWTEEELNGMTVTQIEGLAAYKNYEISGANKAEKVAAFLAAQQAAQ